jgi:hypothetical protein
MNDITELAKALNAFQAELVTVGKTAENPFFKSKYADLASIMLKTQPVLTKHGMAVVQMPSEMDGKPALTTMLLHVSGQSIQYTTPLILAKNDPQGLGSAITYMRRYAYAAALQIVIDADDDGNATQYSKPRTDGRIAPKPSDPASTLQKESIMKQLEKLKVAKEEAAAYLKTEYGANAPLTRGDAARILDKMIMDDHEG